MGAVTINFTLGDDYVEVETQVETVDRTGVEMEAMTACAVAALTIYDMCKSADRSMVIGDLALWEKTGGRSGHWRRSSDLSAPLENTAHSRRPGRARPGDRRPDRRLRLRTPGVRAGHAPNLAPRWPSRADRASVLPENCLIEPVAPRSFVPAGPRVSGTPAVDPPPGACQSVRSLTPKVGQGVLTTVVLLVLAIVWGALLVSWLKSRTEGGLADSVGTFRRHLTVLERATPATVMPANRLRTGAIAGRMPAPAYRAASRPIATRGPGAALRPPTQASLRRRQTQKRRRDIFFALAAGTAGSSSWPCSVSAMWPVQIVFDLAFLSYVMLLIRLRNLAAEREIKLTFMPHVRARMGRLDAGPGSPEHRPGSSGL